MLTKRIIACLDCNGGRVVKGVNFVNLRDAGDPAELALKHAESGADEIVLLDITATHEGRKTMFDTVRRTARSLFVPLTVGGGVRTLADAGAVFEAGCDKISINSAAVKDPSLITCIAERFGSQAVIVAIDAKREAGVDGGPSAAEDPHLPNAGSSEAPRTQDPEKAFRVYVAGGRTPTARYVLEWAREAESRGAGEILLTSMDRDGTGIGFDCELTAAVAKAVSIPVIASGGAGGAQHFVEVFQQGRADAALAASIFHFGIHDIGELKLALRASGIPVRWPC